MDQIIGSNFEEILTKVGTFVLVQALVYVILTTSSDIFSNTTSKDEMMMGHLYFKPSRSSSIRRFLALISDVPQSGDASPVGGGPSSS
ncbi:uncharacterized protein LOC124927698 [Impatiens glandulifera]|uniref:uncharacterized protein LOC124927698 n=1 Tax=Impatiens glandulifera TaxID=253017 RepID=UPI001FB14AD0|nr:uncharacterized protein LOC124927698 [Impatiens glandulifera]